MKEKRDSPSVGEAECGLRGGSPLRVDRPVYMVVGGIFSVSKRSNSFAILKSIALIAPVPMYKKQLHVYVALPPDRKNIKRHSLAQRRTSLTPAAYRSLSQVHKQNQGQAPILVLPDVRHRN